MTLVEIAIGVAALGLVAAAAIASLMILNKNAVSTRIMTNVREIVQRNIETAVGVPFTSGSVPSILATTSASGTAWDDGNGNPVPIYTSRDGTNEGYRNVTADRDRRTEFIKCRHPASNFSADIHDLRTHLDLRTANHQGQGSMKIKSSSPNGGFTLAEISIGLMLLALVGGLAYSVLNSSSTLFAKNISLNSTNLSLRSALDRMYGDLNQAYGMPKLINVDGSLAPSSPNTPAAGIAFDMYLAGPYVVTNPGGSGLTASTTTFTMKYYESDSLTKQVVPTAYDVVILDNGTTRPVVRAQDTPSPSSVSSGIRTVTVNLKSSLGAAVSWNSSTTKTAYLVHKKVYIVAPQTGYSELRMYPSAESVTDYSNPSGYIVLARNLSDKTTNNESTPFSIVPDAATGTDFLKIAMRIEDQEFNNYLSVKQAKDFNTFLRVDTMVRPRNAF